MGMSWSRYFVRRDSQAALSLVCKNTRSLRAFQKVLLHPFHSRARPWRRWSIQRGAGIRSLPCRARSMRGRVLLLSHGSTYCFLTPRQGKARLYRRALLCGNFVGTPRDPDHVSIVARQPLARFPIAQGNGLRSPLLVRVSGHYRQQNVVLISILTREFVLTPTVP